LPPLSFPPTGWFDFTASSVGGTVLNTFKFTMTDPVKTPRESKKKRKRSRKETQDKKA